MQEPDLPFETQRLTARFVDPVGRVTEREIEIRTHPISNRTCRIAFSRASERDVGNESLPEAPPDRYDTASCPFCRPQVTSETPRIIPGVTSESRLIQGESILFPNLYPYGSYSAVSLIDNGHYVEIGSASPSSYSDSFINCGRYLEQINRYDPRAIYMGITQNHLPSAGGSLPHPHLQINADKIPPNHHRFLQIRADRFYRLKGHDILSSYLAHEKEDGTRYIGRTGKWEWVAAFAPEGFYEIWGILPGVRSLRHLHRQDWQHLSLGLIYTQRYYRSLGRNSYNLGLLSVEASDSRLELRVVILVRANHAPWVRSDHTSYEVMLGDMTTFSSPEQTAVAARDFFSQGDGDMTRDGSFS